MLELQLEASNKNRQAIYKIKLASSHTVPIKSNWAKWSIIKNKTMKVVNAFDNHFLYEQGLSKTKTKKQPTP